MQSKLTKLILLCLILILQASLSYGYEIESQYTTIIYEEEELLREFNKEVYLGRFFFFKKKRKNVDLTDEVKNNVDKIVERVKNVLSMYPKKLKFKIVLLSSDKDVQRTFKMAYGRNVDFIAFYSPREKTIYVSVDDMRLGVLAHEISHAVIDHYFVVPPPLKIHELLAQYVETHYRD